MSTAPAEIAHRLRVALEATGRSKRGVEKKIGMSPGYLSRLASEDGYGEVSVKHLAAIARELGVRFEWLADGSGAMTEDLAAARERVLVDDDRYPNRARAIAAARLLKMSETAIADVLTFSLSRHGESPDQTEKEWFDLIKDLEAKERLAAYGDDARARDAARSAEMERITKPKLPRRGT